MLYTTLHTMYIHIAHYIKLNPAQEKLTEISLNTIELVTTYNGGLSLGPLVLHLYYGEKCLKLRL